MAEDSGSLDLERFRDLEGRAVEPWIRRAGMVVLAAICVLALAGVVGQVERTSQASGADGRLVMRTPERLRGGLIYQVRFDVRAQHRLSDPRLVLSRGFFQGMTLNSSEPAPADEAGRPDGAVELSYGALRAGERLRVWLQFQVNPIGPLGRHELFAALQEGDRVVARLYRTRTVLP